MSSDDEWTRSRRSRRTGATVATEDLQPSTDFPSVCRLVEKYTMLIERHQQQQQQQQRLQPHQHHHNRLASPGRRKPSTAAVAVDSTTSSATAAAIVSSAAVVDGSSDYSSLSKSAGDQSSPAFSDDAASTAWTRLMDDEPPDDAEHYVHLQQCRHRRLGGGHRHRKFDVDDDRRFSCESLGSIIPGTQIDNILSANGLEVFYKVFFFSVLYTRLKVKVENPREEIHPFILYRIYAPGAARYHPRHS